MKAWKVAAIAFAVGLGLGLVAALFILRGLPVTDLKSSAVGGFFGLVVAAVSGVLYPRKDKKDPKAEGAKSEAQIMATDPGDVVDGLSDTTKGRIGAAKDAGRAAGRAAADRYLDSLHKG